MVRQISSPTRSSPTRASPTRASPTRASRPLTTEDGTYTDKQGCIKCEFVKGENGKQLDWHCLNSLTFYDNKTYFVPTRFAIKYHPKVCHFCNIPLDKVKFDSSGRGGVRCCEHAINDMTHECIFATCTPCWEENLGRQKSAAKAAKMPTSPLKSKRRKTKIITSY